MITLIIKNQIIKFTNELQALGYLKQYRQYK